MILILPLKISFYKIRGKFYTILQNFVEKKAAQIKAYKGLKWLFYTFYILYIL